MPTRYSLSDFDYELPAELIAQHPRRARAAAACCTSTATCSPTSHSPTCRAGRAGRPAGAQRHARDQGAPVRAQGNRRQGRVLSSASRPARGACSQLAREPAAAARAAIAASRRRHARPCSGATATSSVCASTAIEPLFEYLERHGEVPLPPYIARAAGRRGRGALPDRLRAPAGAVAAPTAGLHFDQAMLDALAAARRRTSPSSRCTSAPARSSRCESTISPSTGCTPSAIGFRPTTATAIADARARGGRVVAVGTTSVRALESAAADDGQRARRRGRDRVCSSRRAIASASSTGCSRTSICRSRRC